MSNHNYNYRDNNFRFEQTGDYTLLMQIAPASFSYAITEGKKLLVWEENHPLNELSSEEEEGDLLSQPFKSVVIGLPNSGFTLIPASLYNADKLTDLAKFLDVKPNEQVLWQPLDAENYVIYKVDQGITSLVTSKFSLEHAIFAPQGWISAIAGNNPTHLYLNTDDDKAELLYYKDGRLRFYNIFEFKNADELVYFVSVVALELQLNPHSVTLIVSGDIKLDDKNGKRLAEFFDKVELNNLQILELPEQIVSHPLLALTALSLCGSSEVY